VFNDFDFDSHIFSRFPINHFGERRKFVFYFPDIPGNKILSGSRIFNEPEQLTEVSG